MSKKAVEMLQLGLIILAFAVGWLGYSYINEASAKAGEVLGEQDLIVLIDTKALALNNRNNTLR